MAGITFTRKGRRKHRRRKGKTCRERSLVDYRKAPDASANGPSAATFPPSNRGDHERIRKRQLGAPPLPSCVIDPRKMVPPSGSSLREDENDVQFALRKKQVAATCRTPLSRRQSLRMGADGASSEDESTSRELRSMYRRDSMSHATSKCDSWASPSPSPCCVMSDFPTLTPRRSVIRSLSSESLDSMDSMNSSLPDIPSFSAGSFNDFRSTAAMFASPRRARRRLSIPLKSFSDAGLNLLLKMHEELREVTAQAEQVRREKEKMAPKRSKSRQRKDKEIHSELTKKTKPKASRGGSSDVTTPVTPSKVPVKVKAKKVKSPKVSKESPAALSDTQLTPKRQWTLEEVTSPRMTPTKKAKSKQSDSPAPKAKLAKKTKVKKDVHDDPPQPPTATPTAKKSTSTRRELPRLASRAAPVPSARESSASECKTMPSDSTASTASCTSASAAGSRISRLNLKSVGRDETISKNERAKPSVPRSLRPNAQATEATKAEAPVEMIQVPVLSQEAEGRPHYQRSRMVKEMHKTLTKTVVLETFPRVTITTRRAHEAAVMATPTAKEERSSGSLRMSEGQVSTMIQAVIEDRQEERLGNRQEPSRRPSLKSARRLGSRVQQAIHSLGFN